MNVRLGRGVVVFARPFLGPGYVWLHRAPAAEATDHKSARQNNNAARHVSMTEVEHANGQKQIIQREGVEPSTRARYFNRSC